MYLINKILLNYLCLDVFFYFSVGILVFFYHIGSILSQNYTMQGLFLSLQSKICEVAQKWVLFSLFEEI